MHLTRPFALTLLALAALPLTIACDPAASQECEQVKVYTDEDGDGYGVLKGSKTMCLVPGQTPQGLSRVAGDCAPQDIMTHENAEGVCGDGVDDNCDGQKLEQCPETQYAKMETSFWDCTNGDTPDSVYAYAKVPDGNGFFKDGGCFVFFEGYKDAFFTRLVDIEPLKTNCEEGDENGCTCPSTEGPSYDQRLYAYTSEGSPEGCDISLPGSNYAKDPVTGEKIGQEQLALSNNCRKYLAPLFKQDANAFFYLGGDINTIESRIASYGKVEVACAEAPDCDGAVWASLFNMDIVRNPSFKKK